MKEHAMAVHSCIKEIIDRKENGKLYPNSELITEVCEKYALDENYIRKIAHLPKR